MFKSFPKILTIFFLLIFVIQLSCLLVLLTLPQASQAAVAPGDFTPQIAIPGFTFNKSDSSTGNIARYISAIYKYAIGIVGILAAVVLMVGGVLWIVAGGNATQISEAKAWIGAALTGLILALTSYLILSTVNPALVNLQTTDITKVGKYVTGSCTTGLNVCEENYTQQQCDDVDGELAEGKSCPGWCCSGWNGSRYHCMLFKVAYSREKCEAYFKSQGGNWGMYTYLESGRCSKGYGTTDTENSCEIIK